jgi:hypothetical protein
LTKLFSAVRRAGLAAQAQSDSCKNSALAAAVFADDEVEEGAEFAVEAYVAHEVDAGNALDDSVIRDSILAEQTWAEAESLGGALVVGDLVAEMFEVVVAHQLILCLGGRVGRGRSPVAVRIVVGRGRFSVFALNIGDVGEAYPFSLQILYW